MLCKSRIIKNAWSLVMIYGCLHWILASGEGYEEIETNLESKRSLCFMILEVCAGVSGRYGSRVKSIPSIGLL